MRLQDPPQRHVRTVPVVPTMTWTIGEFHTSPGVQPPEAEEGPFYLAAVPSSADPPESARHLRLVDPPSSDEKAST